MNMQYDILKRKRFNNTKEVCIKTMYCYIESACWCLLVNQTLIDINFYISEYYQ